MTLDLCLNRAGDTCFALIDLAAPGVTDLFCDAADCGKTDCIREMDCCPLEEVCDEPTRPGALQAAR